jgi:hypothetical protein
MMPPSVLSHFRRTFSSQVLRTTREKWIDAAAFIVVALYQVFLGKPSNVLELVAPYICLISFILIVHSIWAVVETWRNITKQPRAREVESPILLPNAGKRRTLVEQPRPPYFQLKLLLVIVVSTLLGSLPCYLIGRSEIASDRTYVYLVPTSELMECKKRAFFVETAGPQILYNVGILLKDNKSGKTYSQTFPEIDPGPRLSDIYFCFTPFFALG